MELETPASQSVKAYVNQMLGEYLSPMVDKLTAFQQAQVAQEYKVADIVSMLGLIQNFVTTYDQEAVVQRESLSKVQSEHSEVKLLSNCLEQKVHYLERELSKV